MLTDTLAPYMRWAKTHPPAEFDLAGSNLLPCTLDDLPGIGEALQLTADNDNGYRPLVEAIAAHTGADETCVVTATGCSGANFLAIAALVGAGDHVLVEQPGYDPLFGACALMGARVTRLPRPFSLGFQIDLDATRAAITPDTRLIIVTSPHNPSGVRLDTPTLQALIKMADGVGAHVLVDEVYLNAVNLAAGSPAQAGSAAALDGPVIVSSSLTKSFGLSGLRCGWAVAPAGVARRMHLVRDVVDVVGSAPSDRLSTFAFSQIERLAVRTRNLVAANLDVAREFCGQHPQLTLAQPPQATVMFPRLDGATDTSAFVADLASRHGVAVAPGRYFDAPDHFRVSLAGRTDRLIEGLKRIGQALSQD